MLILIFQAIFLGIIQGLTEFLPISSSAHLVFFQNFFPFLKENALQFDLVLHLGTLLALLVFFFPDFKFPFFLYDRRKKKDFLKLILAVALTVIIIFPFKDIIEKIFQMPKLAGLMLFVTAGFLFFASKKRNNQKEEISYKDSFIIGAFQALSAFPGISRSGITISSGILSGLKSKTAFNFSFLMAIPLILGASLIELSNFNLISRNLFLPAIIGFVFSFVFGLIALKWLRKIISLENSKLIYFSLYCFLFGLLILIVV